MYQAILKVVVCLFFVLPSVLYADIRGNSLAESVHSKILDEDRELLIYLPNSYEGTLTEYPVLYLLDGQRNFAHAVGTLDLLNQSDMAAETIVVAIMNRNRSRDFTPTHDSNYDQWGSSGGAEKFLDFIEKELQPHIDTNYRTNGFRILSGHSLGGLLVVHTLHTRPELFQAYFSFSPSLWWHDEIVFSDASSLYAGSESLDRYLFINMGNESGNMRSAFDRYVELLNAQSLEGFSFDSDLNTAETHNTTALAGHNLAYRNLFQLLQPSPDQSFPSVEAINSFFIDLGTRYSFNAQPTYQALNQFGYNALTNEDVETALDVFLMNAENHPFKADAYDSLADGYEAIGDLSQALRMRSRAIEVSFTENVEQDTYKVRKANLMRKMASDSPTSPDNDT